MKKNIILMALAVAALAACDKSVPYEPGAPMNLDNPNVYFSAYNSTKTVLASDATEFEVAILRDDVETALTLPLNSACSYEGIFTVPETVEFPAGVDSVSFKVQVSDKVEMFQTYQLHLSVPEEYTHAYVPVETTGPQFIANVVKEDYAPFANGLYYDGFWTGELTENVLEYSPLKDEYRLNDVWGTGVGLTFTWNQETGEVKLGADKYASGLIHPNYGAITANTVSAMYAKFAAGELLKDSCEGFYFNFKWTVSAGSFGEYPNIFIVMEVL